MPTPDLTSQQLANDEPKRILIIEDDLLLATAVRRRLERGSMKVEVVANGRDGLQAARDHEPDAIVLDLLLPGMNGFDVLRSLKENDLTRDIPVLILSNLSGSDNERRGHDLGAEEYLVKPEVTLQVIIDTVRGLIERRTQSQPRES